MLTNPKEFDLSITEIRRYSLTKDEFWIIMYVGKLSFDENNILFREIFLRNIPKNQYQYANKWEIDRIIKIPIREENMVFYTIGTIFNSQGNPVKNPSEEKPIYKNEIILSNKSNLKKEGLKDLLTNTFFPVNEILAIDNDTSYFYYSNKNKQFIIPNFLIAKFFYYYSITIIQSIFKKEIYDNIKFRTIQGKEIVIYDSTLINSSDITLLARYNFTKHNNGLNMLKQSINNFYYQIINRDKLNQQSSSNIEYLIPFDFPLKVMILGQYISKDIFCAYEINSISPYNPNNKFFTVDNFDLFDINDKTSSINKDKRPIKEGKNIQGIENSVKGNNYLNDNKTTNSVINQATFKQNNRNFFYDSPSPKKLERTDQLYKYISEKIFKEYDDYGISNGESDSKVKTRKVNIENQQKISPFDIFSKALDIIIKKNDFGVNHITIYNSDQNLYSNTIYNYNGNSLINYIIKFQIVRITYSGKEYCLIESGTNFHIGIFENLNISFLEKNDPNLTNFIDYMLQTYNFRWSDVYFNSKLRIKDENQQILKEKREKFEAIISKFGCKIMQPLNHLDPFEKKEEEELKEEKKKKEKVNLPENLANRIMNRIKRNQ